MTQPSTTNWPTVILAAIGFLTAIASHWRLRGVRKGIFTLHSSDSRKGERLDNHKRNLEYDREKINAHGADIDTIKAVLVAPPASETPKPAQPPHKTSHRHRKGAH